MNKTRAIARAISTGHIAVGHSSSDRRSFRASTTFVLLAGCIATASCTPQLDHANVEAQLQEDLGQQPGIVLASVDCPENVAIAANISFVCTGTLEPEGMFPITVTQKDDQGTVEWQVPNSKGLLNLATLEAQFQEAIATETGTQPSIDCGSAYRINKPGDRFACRVIDAAPITAGQTQARLVNVLVTLDAEGNVTWQQIRRQQTLAAASTATPSASSASGVSGATRSTASPSAAEPAPSAQPASIAAPAAGTAEDFLNNPGALDGF